MQPNQPDQLEILSSRPYKLESWLWCCMSLGSPVNLQSSNLLKLLIAVVEDSDLYQMKVTCKLDGTGRNYRGMSTPRTRKHQQIQTDVASHQLHQVVYHSYLRPLVQQYYQLWNALKWWSYEGMSYHLYGAFHVVWARVYVWWTSCILCRWKWPSISK